MEQKEKTKLIWFSILTITLGSIASFLLYFAGWVASMAAFITMFVLIFIYKKFCENLPNKKTLICQIVTVNITHIATVVLAMFVTSLLGNGAASVILLIVTIVLTVIMSLFGSLSAYQYYNNVFKTCEIIATPTQNNEQQPPQQQTTEKTE